ncbi:phage tail tape measure protein [Parabacteroides distasonis]|uniref:phage tail tape measure protein n=1 Tax=Parabacteroides distasonis TaxID=823 RepID=UPI000E38D5A0|nr:phage tail tape measure protein [Parabacteroides distasonis]REC36828.1 phage tail tape measure protein [Parabacteroides distasonis]
MAADLFVRILFKNNEFDRSINKTRKQVSDFKKVTESVGGSIVSMTKGFATLGGISFALMDVTKKSMEFEKSLSGLRSLTGLGAKDMEYFKKAAIDLGSTSTQTASQVVEAYKLIGSQQPELLKNREALNEVTKQAIILAEAAGMDVPSAAKALSGSINQMGESANVAGEYINILAAASQAGSADIQYLSKAIEKSGGAANSVGVKYNELVAAIETIAPKITEASEAGTNLRNIFLILEGSSDNNLRPSVVGLSKALDNLASKNLDATQMTKMFGRESVTAALALVNAKDQYKGYIDAITGTNTALEQQRINNANLEGSLNAVSSAWEGFILTMNKSNGFLSTAAQGVASLIQNLTDLAKTQDEIQEKVIGDKANKIVDKIKGAYDANISGGLSKQRSIELTAIEYDETEAYKIDVLKSDLSSLTMSLGDLEKRRKELAGMPGYYNRKERGDILQSIHDTKERIKYIQEELSVREKADAKIKEFLNNTTLKDKTDKGKPIAVSDVAAKGSIDYIETQISDLSKKLKSATDEATRQGIRIAIEKLKDEKLKIEMEPLPEGSIDYLNAQISSLTKKLNTETDEAVRQGIRTAIEKINKEKYNIELEATLGRLKPMEGDKFGVSAKGRNATEDIKSGYISVKGVSSDAIKSNYDYADSLGAIGNMMSSVSQLTNDGAASWLSYASNIIQAVGQALPQLSALATKNASVAATGAAASVSSIPVVGWVMAGTAVASVIAAMANIPKFANGGIVPGNLYSGDRVPAMVNSGEMILNRSQQGRLFDILNSKGGVNGKDVRVTGEVVVSGEQMKILLDNTNRKLRRGR